MFIFQLYKIKNLININLMNKKFVFSSIAVVSLGIAGYLLKKGKQKTVVIPLNDKEIIKIPYSEFIDASNGNLDLVAKIVKVFKNQKMLVLTNVPKIKQLRKSIYEKIV